MLPVPPSGSRVATFRNAFISGAILLAPLIVTIWAFTTIIEIVGGTFRPFYGDYLPHSLQRIPFFWDMVATTVVVMLVTTLGYFSNYVFGRYFLGVTERAILRIPGLGGLYNSVKQLVATFRGQDRNVFSKVVLIEFPRRGLWSVGFLTSKMQGEPQAKTTFEAWSVFVPTTPNPTTGFLLLLPKEDIIELEMSVGDGMKMIVSGGTVLPPWPTPPWPTPPAAASGE